MIARFVARAVAEPRRELPAEVERLRLAEALLDKGDPLGCLTLLGALLAEHPEERSVRMLAARAHYHSAQLSRARDRTMHSIVATIHAEQDRAAGAPGTAAAGRRPGRA